MDVAAFRRLFFLVPGTSRRYLCGNLIVLRQLVTMLRKLGLDVWISTTVENSDPCNSTDTLSFDRACQISHSAPHESLYILTWGPRLARDLHRLSAQLPSARVAVYAQSSDVHYDLPVGIPVAAVSRYVVAHWCTDAPGNYCTLVPPPISEHFYPGHSARDIDVLVHTYKQNVYCLDHLVPALKQTGLHVVVLDNWLSQEQFASFLRRSKLFLYVTALYAGRGEAFGLPAAEAVACGALVGSNLLGGVTDFLTPGGNCVKLQSVSLRFDVYQIHKALQESAPNKNDYSRTITVTFGECRVLASWRAFLANCHEIYSMQQCDAPKRQAWLDWLTLQWVDREEGFFSGLAKEVLPNRKVIVIDDYQLNPERLAAIICRHEIFCGRPQNGNVAVAALRSAVKNEEIYVAIPWCSFWWREHYKEMMSFLYTFGQCMMDDQYGVIFYLREGACGQECEKNGTG